MTCNTGTGLSHVEKFLKNVGLSNKCYTEELKNPSKTFLGERHNKGRIGKLL